MKIEGEELKMCFVLFFVCFRKAVYKLAICNEDIRKHDLGKHIVRRAKQ